MPLKNNFVVWFLFLMAICTGANSAVTKNLSLKYSGESVNFNYGEAPWRNEFIGIDISRCDKTDACTIYLNSQKQPSNSGLISGVGLYFVEFYTPEEKFFGDKIDKSIIYSQYVAILPIPGSEISQIASAHLPKFSFHANESYFPVSVEELFNRNLSDLDDVKSKYGGDSDSLLDLLAYNGSSKNKFSLKSSVAKAIKGNPSNFPVYYFHQTSGDDLWITYFVLYAYDEKRNEYLAGGMGAEKGSHSIDRESITIKFQKNNGAYLPKEVVYAGHLESQPTTFLGCITATSCSLKGELTAKWENGKTTVDWANVSRSGDKPIVYVAHGSHAMKPAYGWYFLDVGTKLFNVTEPAGDSVSANLMTGALIAVDFEKPAFQPLTYSGFLIKGAGLSNNWYRIFPFVRFPADKWASTSNKVFNDCVVSKQGCEKYINQLISPTITDLTFTPVSATAAAKLTATFSTDMQSSYSTTGAYVPKVGKEGYWPDARTFVVEFDSYTPNGKITLVTSGFKSVSGQPLAADRVYIFPQDKEVTRSDWLSWDGERWTKDSITTVDGGITNAREFGGLIYKLPTPVDGDNFVFEIKARWNPSLSGYSGKDIAISLDNRYSSGQIDSSNQPKITRSVQANFRTNGWSDIITINSDAGPFQKFIGTTNTVDWHVYKVEAYNRIVSVYVDGSLKYTYPYSGIVGKLDTFSAAALAGIAIDPGSLKVSQFK